MLEFFGPLKFRVEQRPFDVNLVLELVKLLFFNVEGSFFFQHDFSLSGQKNRGLLDFHSDLLKFLLL